MGRCFSVKIVTILSELKRISYRNGFDSRYHSMNQIVSEKPDILSGRKPVQKNKTNRIVRVVHSYTSMLMLTIMLFFTLTGITLNHRDWFDDSDKPSINSLSIPSQLSNSELWDTAPLDQAHLLRKWLGSEHAVYGNKVSYEWEAEERFLVIDIKRPGGYSIIEADISSGEIVVEQQKFGVIATANDLHMGRYSGSLWRGFIDFSAIMMLLFTLTGLWLVLPQKKKRHKLFAISLLGTGLMLSAYLWLMMV